MAAPVTLAEESTTKRESLEHPAANKSCGDSPRHTWPLTLWPRIYHHMTDDSQP